MPRTVVFVSVSLEPGGFLAAPATRKEHTVGRNYLRAIVLIGFVLSAGALLAQEAPQDAQEQGAAGQGASDQGAAASASAPAQASAPTKKSFVVNGKTVNAEVLVVDGRSYIDLDSLAQIADITNGSLTVEPNQISLTIPVQASSAAGSNAAVTNAPATGAATAQVENETPPSLPGFSKGFVSNAINALAEMREWKAATETMITYGLAVSEAWAQGYRSQAQDDLTQASLAAATDDDRNALTLLRNEFDALDSWSGGTIAARQALNGAPTIDPNTLQNDPVLAKINACGDFLSGMLLSGTFTDNANCH